MNMAKQNLKYYGNDNSGCDIKERFDTSGCVIEKKRGYKPSDLYDHNKEQFLVKLSEQMWQKNDDSNNTDKKIDLRKIFTPATDADQLLPKNRKLYASSAFYSPTLHPTVEDQVALARQISYSLSDISNQKSKGQSMYVNRRNRSIKWIHESSNIEKNESNFQNIEQSTSDKNDNLNGKENEITCKPFMKNISLRILMNPNGQIRDFNSLRHTLNVETGLLSPIKCAELVSALQTHKGKGAELFEKRRKIAEKWIIDGSNQIGQSTLNYKSNAIKDNTNSNIIESKVGEQNIIKPTNELLINQNKPCLSKNQKEMYKSTSENSIIKDAKRVLAYEPSIPRGWNAERVTLPKNLYVPKEISWKSYKPPPSLMLPRGYYPIEDPCHENITPQYIRRNNFHNNTNQEKCLVDRKLYCNPLPSSRNSDKYHNNIMYTDF